MAQAKTWVAFDVHVSGVVAAVLDRDCGELRVRRLPGSSEEVVAFAAGLAGPVRATYEAGPTGFALTRRLEAAGVDCLVCAAGLIVRGPSDRVTTDRRDAERLVRLLIAGELRAVAVPSVEAESLRDLVRAREVVHARPARARKSERTPALAGIRQMRPRGFEPPRTIRSTRPSTMAPPHRWVAIPLARAVSALHVARSFAQLGPRIGAGLAGQFRDARDAPVAGTAGDKRAAISENDLGLRHRETCKPIEASKPLNAYRAAVKRAFGRSRRSRGLPTGGRLGGRSPTGHAGRWGRPGSKRRVQLTASTVSPASVAASMSFTTSAGWETIARCPEETSAIVAPMRLANMRCASGGSA